MNADEALKLCRLAKAASPAQAVDEYTPELWALALQRERFVDAQQALIDLAREQEWIHVSHIVKRVRKIRSDRVAAFGAMPDPPSGLSDAEEWEWMKALAKRIADGEEVPRPAIGQADVEHQRHMATMVRGAFQLMPDE